MAKFTKLPDNLKAWKINSIVSEESSCEVYKVSRKEYDGSVKNAILRHISVSGDNYSGDAVDFYQDEAGFLNTISRLGDSFNYIEVDIENEPAKNRLDLYIITEDLVSLAEIINIKTFNDDEIIDFGIQICNILEKLESNNIYHGNLKPENIYITPDNKYLLGDFSDCESKINDFQFVAPEIYNKANPDFTTDIYSLGIIMYYMCNNKKLPFESSTVNSADAVQERLSGKAVTAPANGSEKLKSVIVIACQFDNKNRWKNAVNIKNALTSILNGTDDLVVNSNPGIIPPENTDFSDNLFEDYEYIENNDADEKADKEADKIDCLDNDAENSDLDKTRVFKSVNNEHDFSSFDSYFEDEPKQEPVNNSDSGEFSKNDFTEDGFENYEEPENFKKSNIAIVIIIAAIVIILGALGVVAFMFFNGAFTPSANETKSTTVAVESTTAEATTVEPTTKGETKTIISYIDYWYSYAKDLIEKEGFKVEVVYEYKEGYDPGYVIDQSPKGNTDVEVGSVIKLTVSSNDPNTDNSNNNDESSTSNSNTASDEYILPNSGTAYVTQSEIDALSDYDLQMAINEIYARRGRIYTTPELNQYFTSKSWYEGKYTSDEFDQYVTLNEYEEANIDALSQARDAR